MSELLSDGWARVPAVRVGAIVAIALAIAFVVWLLVRGDDSPSSESPTLRATPTAQGVGPVANTPAKLHALSGEMGHAIYWVGPEPNRTYELTRTARSRIFVRYLPRGVPIGIRRAAFTIVGTYPVPKALDVLKDLSKKIGEKQLSVPNDGFAVYSAATPTNIYVAYPGSDLQIEVFDPSPQRARRLVTSGQVAPVR